LKICVYSAAVLHEGPEGLAGKIMAIADRIKLYGELEEHRKRPLIVYVTSGRADPSGQVGRMDADAIPELCDQLETLDEKVGELDLLVVSDGGDPMVAWRAVTLLRERTDHLTVMVPQSAYSAATLLALGASKILMHPNGNLGPVDPQIMVRHGEEERSFGFEDMMGFLQFVQEEVKLTDQEHIRAMFEMFCNEVGATAVGVAARSSLLSLSMGEKLLRLHMTKEADIPKAQSIAKALSKGFFYHGYPVGRKEAADINLPLADPDPRAENLIWRIWLDVESELEVRKPFVPLHLLMASSEGPKLMKAVPQLNLPANAPPDVVQQILENFVMAGIQEIEPVGFEIITAIMESRRHSSREVRRGKILAYRSPNLDIQVNAITTGHAWESAKI